MRPARAAAVAALQRSPVEHLQFEFPVRKWKAEVMRKWYLVPAVTSFFAAPPATDAGRRRGGGRIGDVTGDVIASVDGANVAQDLLFRLALGGDEASLGSGRKAPVGARKRPEEAGQRGADPAGSSAASGPRRRRRRRCHDDLHLPINCIHSSILHYELLIMNY